MFSKFFISRPIFACVVSILIVLLGATAYTRLPVAQYPELAPPIVHVEARYPGANAQVVADTVAAPIEQEVNGVDRMIYMTSTSADGIYSLDISFEPGADIDLAAVLVQNRVNAAEAKLPEDVRRQGVTTKKQSSSFVGALALWSDDGRYDDLYLSNYAAISVKDEIARIYGVGGYQIFPSKDYGMRVWLDPEKLKARRLTVGDVAEAIREQNVQVAAGAVGRQPAPPEQNYELIVTTKGRLTEPEEFADIIVWRSDDGRIVRVRDVARTELGARDYGTEAVFNGKPAAVMVIFQLPGANLVDVAGAVTKKVDELRRSLPEGLQMRFFYDSSMFIRSAITEVNKTLIEAFLLVFLVVLVFLQSFRATIIPAITIPVSLVGTFIVMAALGFSVNMLTMFGLVLAIGIVVDDAIVVVENVERNLSLGSLSPAEATAKAMKEITGPVVAITLVLMAVFLPTAAMPGLTGSMYRQFALTIAAATLFSAINALTLSPALCALLLRRHDPAHKPSLVALPFSLGARAFNRVFGALTSVYAITARLSIRAWPLTLVAFVGTLVATVFVYHRVPTGFVPDEDLGFIVVSAQLPDGASLNRTRDVIHKVGEELRQIPGVADVGALSGFSLIDGQGANVGNCWAVLKPWDERTDPAQNLQAIMGEAMRRVSAIQEAQFLVFALPAIPGLGNSSGFDMRIQDKGIVGRQTMEQVVGEVSGAAGSQAKILYAFSSYRSGVPQVYVDVDREKALKLDVPLSDVFETLQTALGSSYVNDFNLFNRTFQVNMQADTAFRLDAEDIMKLEVRTRSGTMLPLGTLAAVTDAQGPDRVTRYNLYPSATINGAPAPGASSGEALALMEQIAAEKFPRGMGFEWTGMSYQERLVGNQGLYILALGLLIVYLLLAAQYESWAAPISVVLSVPLVAIGAMVAVNAAGLDNNVFTQIGLVLLIGLGAKNAILIVEFARANRAAGKTILESAVESARTRLRPILMTSFAFILGVVPLMLANGAGAASRKALGTAVFGGMIGATFLGLLFTPALFVVVQRIAEAIKPPKPTRAHERSPAPAAH